MLRIVIAGILLALLAGCASNPVSRGYQAAKSGDYQGAINHWEPAARAGNPVALYNLGLFALDGLGMPQDREKAIRLFTLAAQGGFQPARYELSNLGAPVPEPRQIDPAVLMMLMNQAARSQPAPYYRPVVPSSPQPMVIPQQTYQAPQPSTTRCERNIVGQVECRTTPY